MPDPSKNSSNFHVFNYHLYIDNLQVDNCDFEVTTLSSHGSVDLSAGNFPLKHSILTFKYIYPMLKALPSQAPN